MNATVDILDDSEPKTGINWITVGEILEDAGISWKVYMEMDNFDDNGFAWFEQYRKALPGNPLFDKGMVRHLNVSKTFTEDFKNGDLPQVSFLINPAWLSEHAGYHPADGEEQSSKFI